MNKWVIRVGIIVFLLVAIAAGIGVQLTGPLPDEDEVTAPE